MRILHIAKYASGRTYKQVLAQQSAGWDVTLMACLTGHPELHEMVSKSCSVPSGNMLKELDYNVAVVHTTCATAADADVMPALLTNCQRLVWDCHDLTDIRPVDKYDAVIVPSKGYQKHLPGSHVVYSKVPSSLWPAWADREIAGCILTATLSANQYWSDYRPVTTALPLFVLPANVPVEPEFETMNVLQKQPYRNLLGPIRATRRHERHGTKADHKTQRSAYDGIRTRQHARSI